MLRRLARWLLREEIAEEHSRGWLKGHHEGLEAGRIDAMDSTVDTVRSLLQSGHMCFLPFRAQSDQPLSFVRPKEPFHLLAAEVQMSEQPSCETASEVAATLSPEAWARARAVEQLLPKLARMLDAKMTDREAVKGLPGRRRYTVAISVQQAEEL